MRHKHAFTPCAWESLEGHAVPSGVVGSFAGMVTVLASTDELVHNLSVHVDGIDASKLDVTLDGQTTQFDRSAVRSILYMAPGSISNVDDAAGVNFLGTTSGQGFFHGQPPIAWLAGNWTQS